MKLRGTTSSLLAAIVAPFVEASPKLSVLRRESESVRSTGSLWKTLQPKTNQYLSAGAAPEVWVVPAAAPFAVNSKNSCRRSVPFKTW